MIRSVVSAIVILAATSAVARTEIVNIDNAPIPDDLNIEAITGAITAGAVDRGWTPKVLGTGHVEARLFIRSHTATVDITFNESTYSITYKDSTNLDYDGGRIHRNYNRWVASLNSTLQRSLAMATATDPSAPRDAAPVAHARAPAAQGVYSGEMVTIASKIPVAASTSVPGTFRECAVEEQVANFLHDLSPRVQIGTIPGGGHYIDMAITEVHLPGGGAWSGPKWLEVTGTLFEGDGDIVASFRAKRFSTGGAFAVFKGGCSIIGRCAKAIAGDIDAWLRNPVDGAELGDAR